MSCGRDMRISWPSGPGAHAIERFVNGAYERHFISVYATSRYHHLCTGRCSGVVGRKFASRKRARCMHLSDGRNG